jgi:hypothetical protein
MTGTKQKVASAGASKDPKIDPSKERKKKRKLQPSFNSRIKVAVRLRPKTTKEEAEKEEPVIFVDGSNIQLLTNIGETFFFTCDGCFSSDSISAVAQNNISNKEKFTKTWLNHYYHKLSKDSTLVCLPMGKQVLATLSN